MIYYRHTKGGSFMAEPKKAYSYRLSKQTISELESLCRSYKQTPAKIIAILIHAAYTGVDSDEWTEWFNLPF